MENPEALAGAHVEAAHIAFVVAHALRRHALAKRRADDHGVFRNHRRRLNSDFTGIQVGHPFAFFVPRRDGLVIVALEIHDAVFAEGRHALAGLRVQTN